MENEDGFLAEIRARPRDLDMRSVYADWLEEQGDPRGLFLRVQLALLTLAPDHPNRSGGEAELSRLRSRIAPDWLALFEPERARLREAEPDPRCRCFTARGWARKRSEVRLHDEPQDTECVAWKKLLELIEQSAADRREIFRPRDVLSRAEWREIVTLPASIATLKAVRLLNLYGSWLVRLPREIGEMESLECLRTDRSYRLHWYPYEIARCPRFQESMVMTKALYGNYMRRPPFPDLRNEACIRSKIPTHQYASLTPWHPDPTRKCSVCNRPFVDTGAHRVWITLLVAQDVLPLLVNACSPECVQRLPEPPTGYIKRPHTGGPLLKQPDPW